MTRMKIKYRTSDQDLTMILKVQYRSKGDVWKDDECNIRKFLDEHLAYGGKRGIISQIHRYSGSVDELPAIREYCEREKIPIGYSLFRKL